MNGDLHVAGDITSTGDIGCNGVLATHLTVSGTWSSIPGYEKTTFSTYVNGNQYTSQI